MEHRRPENIPGYVHPGTESYSKNNIYKTFTEGQKPKKIEKFGTVSVGTKYSSARLLDDTDDLCPVCSSKYVKICNCVYSDKTCVNNHVWYTERGNGNPKVGNPHKK